MIYFLSGLKSESYCILQEVFHLYERGELDKIPKSKQQANSKPDCKGSNFKGLSLSLSLCVCVCEQEIHLHANKYIHNKHLSQQVSVVLMMKLLSSSSLILRTRKCFLSNSEENVLM